MIGSFALCALILLLIAAASSIRSEAISQHYSESETVSGAAAKPIGWGRKR
ncbi:hypothetical protein [Paenibacillus sophorae]|uniref:Uncharacterized protein n=1 Tax=Paenibacillus sophorae TaxID=1333845 RepID=A0ABX8HEM9_9BACL|nr:hypothetical protein [Paenibacillus sophorae]QWU15425.1 hypothetical protein KP014_26725 [Paenibacillus sophorae]